MCSLNYNYSLILNKLGQHLVSKTIFFINLNYLLIAQVLSVSNNFLICLPRSIGKLYCLSELDASHCFLSYIPDELTSCHRLSFLNLSHNKSVENL